VFELVGFVDVEGEIALQFRNLGFSDLALLEVGLSLLLQRRVRLHQVVVKLDELLHLSEGVTSHLCLRTHLARRCLLMRILVAVHESRVLSHQQLDPLLVLHLRAHLRLGE